MCLFRIRQLHKMAPKVFSFNSATLQSGKGESVYISHGYSCIKGKAKHPMEDVLVSEYRDLKGHKLGLFAVYDGHLGHSVAVYLKDNLFENIMQENELFSDPKRALSNAYHNTDTVILEKSQELGPGGSTAVSVITIDNKRIIVANVGDSRAVMCKNGKAEQLSVDHEPSSEREEVERRGGFVTKFLGDVARVDGQLAVSRAFGDKSLKQHLSAEPDFAQVDITDDFEFLILASDGLWKVLDNQQAVDLIRDIDDPEAAARRLTGEAMAKKSKDDISCIVVRLNPSCSG